MRMLIDRVFSRRFGSFVVASSFSGALALGAIGCGETKDSQSTTSSTVKQGARHGLSAEEAGEILVKIGEREITVGEFADKLADQSPYLRARFNNPQHRREFLDNMVRFELLVAEAQKRGLANSPELERSKKQLMIQQMLKEEIDNKVTLESVPPDEIKGYYDAHLSEYQTEAQVRISHLLKKSKKAAQKALKDIAAKEGDLEKIRAYIRDQSDDATTSEQGGDLRFVSKPVAPDESGNPNVAKKSPANEHVSDQIASAGFSIDEVGQHFPTIVEDDAGFHIVILTDKRKKLDRKLEEVEHLIREKLWREKRFAAREAFIASLMKNAKVVEHEDVLASVKVQADEAKPHKNNAKNPAAKAPAGKETK